VQLGWGFYVGPSAGRTRGKKRRWKASWLYELEDALEKEGGGKGSDEAAVPRSVAGGHHFRNPGRPKESTYEWSAVSTKRDDPGHRL